MPRGEAFDVKLVNQRLVPWCARRHVVAPTERRIYHHTLGQAIAAVALVRRQIGIGMTDRIAKQVIAPLDRSGNRHGIRIQQQLCRIEAMALLGFVGSVHSVTIKLPKANLRKINVPDVRGLFS